MREWRAGPVCTSQRPMGDSQAEPSSEAGLGRQRSATRRLRPRGTRQHAICVRTLSGHYTFLSQNPVLQ